jgi:hypothetical protein
MNKLDQETRVAYQIYKLEENEAKYVRRERGTRGVEGGGRRYQREDGGGMRTGLREEKRKLRGA